MRRSKGTPCLVSYHSSLITYHLPSEENQFVYGTVRRGGDRVGAGGVRGRDTRGAAGPEGGARREGQAARRDVHAARLHPDQAAFDVGALLREGAQRPRRLRRAGLGGAARLRGRAEAQGEGRDEEL